MAAVVARHLSLGVPATEVRTTPTMRLGSRMRSAELMPAALVALVRSRAVARRRSVVIHVHVADGGSLVREGGLVRLAHRMGLPTVATVHASVLPDVVAHDGDRLRSVLERADAVHALGDRSARLLATVTDRPESIRVIPNWVDLPPDDPAPGDVGEVVVFAGLVGRR
jgi:glycosyltransferase involved in cell wall biosynthesis